MSEKIRLSAEQARFLTCLYTGASGEFSARAEQSLARRGLVAPARKITLNGGLATFEDVCPLTEEGLQVAKRLAGREALKEAEGG